MSCNQQSNLPMLGCCGGGPPPPITAIDFRVCIVRLIFSQAAPALGIVQAKYQQALDVLATMDLLSLTDRQRRTITINEGIPATDDETHVMQLNEIAFFAHSHSVAAFTNVSCGKSYTNTTPTSQPRCVELWKWLPITNRGLVERYLDVCPIILEPPTPDWNDVSPLSLSEMRRNSNIFGLDPDNPTNCPAYP